MQSDLRIENFEKFVSKNATKHENGEPFVRLLQPKMPTTQNYPETTKTPLPALSSTVHQWGNLGCFNVSDPQILP
jgi:hypothetical protein